MLLSGGAKVNLQNKVRPHRNTWLGPPCLRLWPQLAACCGRKLGSACLRPCSPAPSDRSGAATPRVCVRQLGQTALHCAAGYGALPIVEELVRGGADKSISDMDGNTPCELANNYGARLPRPPPAHTSQLGAHLRLVPRSAQVRQTSSTCCRDANAVRLLPLLLPMLLPAPSAPVHSVPRPMSRSP